ncbi:unnamed protein product [Tenebrio molitor]|nr:unnamed protein product [Tenebrio molitor]
MSFSWVFLGVSRMGRKTSKSPAGHLPHTISMGCESGDPVGQGGIFSRQPLRRSVERFLKLMPPLCRQNKKYEEC